MPAVLIQPQRLTQLFSGIATFNVPPYQRGYQWTAANVTDLLDYIHDHATGDSPDDGCYLHHMILHWDGLQRHDVVDGQQRLTTLYVILGAIVRRYGTITGDTDADDRRLQALKVALSADATGRATESRITTYDDNLNAVLADVAAGRRPERRDDIGSARHLRQAHNTAFKWLRVQFHDDTDALLDFGAWMLQHVSVAIDQTQCARQALVMFEKHNSAGCKLRADDLIKSAIISQATSDDSARTIADRFLTLTDELEAAGDKKPENFFGYYTRAVLGCNRDNIVESFRHALTGDDGRSPEQLSADLLRAGRHYINFTRGRNTDGTRNPHLRNILTMSDKYRQHYALLLAARTWPKDTFVALSRQIELYAAVRSTASLSPSGNQLPGWATAARQIGTDDTAGQQTLLDDIADARRGMAQEFHIGFGKLRLDDRTTSTRAQVAYLLAKVEQDLQRKADGKGRRTVDVRALLDGDADVEHILPRKPSVQALEEFGLEYPGELIGRIGNLTLLRQRPNGRLSNRPYSAKRDEYRTSGFYITSGLVVAPHGLNGTTPPAFDSWTPDSVEARQRYLYRRLCDVLDVPAVQTERPAVTA